MSHPRDVLISYLVARQALMGVIELVHPYTWREAELAEAHTFGEVVANEAASGKAYLNLNTDARPGREGYSVQMKFSVPEDDVYSLWLSCSPQGAQASQFSWIVDTEEPHSSSDAQPRGAPYLADEFAWLELGNIKLKRGPHTFTLRITDRAAGSNRYVMALDAFLAARTPFAPNGTTKPFIAIIKEKPGRKPDLFGKPLE